MSRLTITEIINTVGINTTTTNITVSDQLASSAGGDLSGNFPSPSVVKIQGRSVQNHAPLDGESLIWVNANSRWEPGFPATTGLSWTWYVSAEGDDTADGKSPSTAFLTLAKALTVVNPADTVKLRRGDTWTESFVNLLLDDITIESYGAGDLPTIDCSDDVSGQTWTLVSGSIYKTATIDFSDLNSYPGKIHAGVYVDGVQLVEAASSALNAGEFYVDTVNEEVFVRLVGGGSPAAANIRFTTRALGIGLKDRCTVRGIRTMRNAHDDGSIRLSLNALVEDCECNDGSKHNLFVESGYVKNTLCYSADKRGTGDANMNSATMFVAYSNDPKNFQVVFENCRAIMPGYNSAFSATGGTVAGFYCHGQNSSNYYGKIAFKDCYVENMDLAYSGDWKTCLLYRAKSVGSLKFCTGGSTTAGSATYLIECISNMINEYFGFPSGKQSRPVELVTRSVVMRDTQIVNRSSQDFLVDSISNSITVYDIQYCTFLLAPNIRSFTEGIIKVRSNQTLTMSNCALFQDEEAANPDSDVAPVVVVDTGATYTGSNNLYHAGYRANQTDARRVRFDYLGTMYTSEATPSGNGSTSALWKDGSNNTGTFDGTSGNGPVLPRSTRLPWDVGGDGVEFELRGMTDAPIVNGVSRLNYPRKSGVAISGFISSGSDPVKVYGSGHYPKNHKATLAIFDIRP